MAGHHLDGVFQGMLCIPRIDALRRIPHGKVGKGAQARGCCQGRGEVLHGESGVDGGFQHHQHARAQVRAQQGAGLQQGAQIGCLAGVHGRGHGDDIHVLSGQHARVGAEEATCRQRLAGFMQLGDARRIDVEAHSRANPGEGAQHRPAHIAQPQNRHALGHGWFWHGAAIQVMLGAAVRQVPGVSSFP